PSLMSVAVTVREPTVLSVTLKVGEPETSAASAGKTALLSDEVIRTVSVAFVVRFQLASTELTVTLNGVSAVWAVTVPLLPVALPGEAVWAGTRICSLANGPAMTATAELVLLATPL